MKKFFLSGICTLFLSFCSVSQRPNNNIVIWTNKTIDTLVFFNDTTSSYQLKPEFMKFVTPFSIKEKELRPKGETYGYATNSNDGRYYTVAKHKDRYGYDYRLITYNIEGENDTEILVSQLNSYQQGTLIDALVLELKFVFGTEYSTHYIINDSVIKIDRYETNGILYTADGDVIGTKDIPDTVIYQSIYKIKDGRFLKSSEQKIR